MEQNSFDLKSVKVYRNTEATIFEGAFVIVAMIVWGLVVWMIYCAPDIVPTHFDNLGRPNSYGSPVSIVLPCIFITIVGIICMITAYFPRYINMPFKINNIRQVEIAIRSIRVAGITTLLLPLAVAYTSLGMSSPSPIPIISVVVLLLLEIIFFSIIIYKAK